MRRTAPPERWRLVLEAIPQHSDASARLDRLVKEARRVYGFECVEREFQTEATLQRSDAEANDGR